MAAYDVLKADHMSSASTSVFSHCHICRSARPLLPSSVILNFQLEKFCYGIIMSVQLPEIVCNILLNHQGWRLLFRAKGQGQVVVYFSAATPIPLFFTHLKKLGFARIFCVLLLEAGGPE